MIIGAIIFAVGCLFGASLLRAGETYADKEK